MLSRSVLASVLMAGFCTVAHSQVIVEINTGSGYGPATGAQATVDGSGNVTILAGNAFYRVRTTSPMTQDIGVITYNGTSDISLVVSTTGSQPGVSIIDEGCQDWAGLAGTGTDHIELHASLHGKVTGDVEAEYITRIDCDGGTSAGTTITQLGPKSGVAIRATNGVLAGDIEFTDPSVFAFNEIEADGISGDISFAGGKIIDILVQDGGDLTGDITVVDGTIGTIFVTGDIGTSASPVSIFAGDDVSGATGGDRFTIELIACQGDIYADITASDGAANEGSFRRIIANQGTNLLGDIPTGMSDVRTDFTGTITTFDSLSFRSVSPFERTPSFVAATFAGEIRFYGKPRSPIYMNSMSADSIIITEDDLIVVNPAVGTEDSMIHIADSDGLKGQIVVNAGAGAFDWTGEFGIGNTPASPTSEFETAASQPYEAPHYERLPTNLGGGAIGLVPFNFHNKGGLLVDPGVSSAQFEAGDTVTGVEENDKEIVIEHYGPVYATGTPLEIHKLVSGPLGTESSWEVSTGVPNDVTSSWDQSVSSTEEVSERTVTISPVGDTWINGWYRAKPASGSGGLKSGFADGNPPPVYESGHGSAALDEYFYFRVLVFSSFDLNQNYSVDTPDATIWTNNPVDFDGDTSADSVDFNMLLDAMD